MVSYRIAKSFEWPSILAPMSAEIRSHAWSKQMSKRIAAANVQLKRAYERPAPRDGTRILIDRLWPRGMTKKSAAIDEWFKDIAPSTALRRWFGHDPDRWEEFRDRYSGEVRQNPGQLEKLRALARQGPVTLVYSAHDEVHNDAVVLRDLLLERRVAARSSNRS
jgi:uncharacterized protein YeaO (DUF488 family)